MSCNFKSVLATMHLNWEDPEEIHIKWFGEDRNTLCDILEKLYPNCDIQKLAFLYQHYDYLENQIHMFIDQDGMAYDKSNWIMKQYFEKLVGGIPDELDDDQIDPMCITRKCDLPEFGTTDEWLEYVEAMTDMYRNGPTHKAMIAIARMEKLRQDFMDKRRG